MDKKKAPLKKEWWVVLQHHDSEVVQASERPSTKVEPGQRAKSVRGPFATKDEASVVAEDHESRTLRAQNLLSAYQNQIWTGRRVIRSRN